MIYWFTGQPCSGKTTLAEALINDSSDNCIHIDGDGLRELFQNFDYSEKGRVKNITSVIDLARFLDSKGFTVVISVVAPYKELRDSLKETNNVIEIYTHTTEVRGREHYFVEDYQKPTEDFIYMDTTDISVELCLEKIPYNKKTNQYSMFIGRWQPFHDGHQWLIDQRIKEGKNILLCIRDVKVDYKNPFFPHQVKKNLEEKFAKEIDKGKIKVMIIPDIESINYGRSVGYDVIEHVPPQQIHNISATKIRKSMGL